MDGYKEITKVEYNLLIIQAFTLLLFTGLLPHFLQWVMEISRASQLWNTCTRFLSKWLELVSTAIWLVLSKTYLPVFNPKISSMISNKTSIIGLFHWIRLGRISICHLVSLMVSEVSIQPNSDTTQWWFNTHPFSRFWNQGLRFKS